MRSDAERMHELFAGFEHGHGTYGAEERRPGSPKSTIKKSARTLREPPSPGLWQQHLDGARPLGIVPIRSGGECYWGVVDVDKYDGLSHRDIRDRLEQLDVPAVVCRSKSGGAHVFLFLRDPVQATDLIVKLREIAAVLGFGDSEIFPKQTEILEDRGDLGNWLNMPYFDAEKTSRYCVNEHGRAMSLSAFLDFAESRRVDRDRFEKILTKMTGLGDDMAEAPPCLQHLCRNRIREGEKNNTMFALGVLAKKLSPEGWQRKMEEWNHLYMTPPPLTSEEMLTIFKSMQRRDYSYTCKKAPLLPHCDKITCSKRRYGVGQAAAPDLASITILDTTPPLFFVRMTSGATVECETDDLLSSRSFQRAALTQLRVLLPMYKQEQWQQRVQECLEEAQVIEAPREASSAGALEELIQQFCTDKHAAQTKEEILLGRPWLDEDVQRHYFRLKDLIDHLERAKFREWTRQKLTQRIRELDGGHHFFNLKGSGVNVFWLPSAAFSPQTEPFDTPRQEGSPI